jgi:ATP-dependent Clp protease protease subunit
MIITQILCQEKNKMSDEQPIKKIFIHEQKNLIYFNAPIEQEYVLELIEHLTCMEQREIDRVDNFVHEVKRKNGIVLKAEDYIKPILLEINSNGGYVHEAFAVVDTIRQLTIPVHTICKGYVASAATFIFLAGTRRFMTKNSFFLIHEISDEITGNFTFMKQTFENSRTLMTHILDYYEEHSNLERNDVMKHIQNEICWNAQTTLKYGFVDEIL